MHTRISSLIRAIIHLSRQGQPGHRHPPPPPPAPLPPEALSPKMVTSTPPPPRDTREINPLRPAGLSLGTLILANLFSCELLPRGACTPTRSHCPSARRTAIRYFSRQAFKYTGEVCRDTTSTQWKQAPRGLISATGSTRRNNGKPERRPPSRMSHPHLSRRRRPYRATSSVMPPPSDRPCLPVKPLPTVKLLHTSPSSHASPRRLLSPRETRGENARPSPRRLVRPSLSHA